MELSKYIIKLCIIIFYFILITVTEIFYSDSLFDKSLEVQRDFQKKYNKDDSSMGKFMHVMTMFGAAAVILPLCAVVAFFVPFNKIFFIMTIYMSATYIDNILKIVYSQARPYWIDHDLRSKNTCEAGYGNPSGHSMTSSSLYTSIWAVLTEHKCFTESNPRYKGIILRIIPLIFVILLVFTIMVSRVYLGAHSINQVIYGFLHGIGIFAVFYILFEITKFKDKDFLLKIKKYSLAVFIIIPVLLCIVFPLYFLRKNPKEDEYYEYIKSVCPSKARNRTLRNEALSNSFSILAIYGMFLGFYFLDYLIVNFLGSIKDNYINILNWDNENYKRRFCRLLFLVPFALPAILCLVISKEANLVIIFVFKYALPFFAVGFLVAGPGLFFSYKWVNKLFKRDDTQREDESLKKDEQELNSFGLSNMEKKC